MSNNSYKRLTFSKRGPAPSPASLDVVTQAPIGFRDPRDTARIINQELQRRALTAASTRVVVDDKQPGHRKMQAAAWQTEVFAFLDQVGELRYATNIFASSASAVKLELVRRDDKGDWVLLSDKEELDQYDEMAMEAMKDFTWEVALSEMIRDLAAQLFLVGEAFLVGVPSSDKYLKEQAAEGDLRGLDWKALSKNDVHVEPDGTVRICGKWYKESEIILIRIWRPHPARYTDADSPVRSSLPVLRELVGLTMHISACIDSRLAGAGIVWMPQSATVLGLGGTPENADEEDPFLEAVIEAGVTAIKDRDSAAAIIPIFATLPDDVGFEPIHMTFSTPFDASTKELRDEAIRRLALGLDMPPEVLLGNGGSSHWSAWSIQEDYIKLHVLPAVGLIATALVKMFLRPVLEDMFETPPPSPEGKTSPSPSPRDYSLRPFAEHMFSRPDRFDEALQLFKLDAISLEAMLETAGFDQKDGVKREVEVDHAVLLAMRAASINPSLIDSPGLMNMISQYRAALAGKDMSDASTEELPPLLQQQLMQGPESDEKRAPTNQKTVVPANDKSKGPPASASDRKTDTRGPAVNRARDNGAK